MQHIGGDRVAQAVEVVDQLPASGGQEQPVGAAILGIMSPLEQAMLHQSIEQAHQRDRLQFEDLGQIDLGQAFLLPQTKQHNPLRAGGATSPWRG